MATKKTISTKRANKQAPKELKAVEFEAALTKSEVFEYEEKQNEAWGVKRRMTLITLTKSRRELIECFLRDEGTAETMLEMIDDITEWRDHSKASTKLAESAIARLLIAGQIAATEMPA